MKRTNVLVSPSLNLIKMIKMNFKSPDCLSKTKGEDHQWMRDLNSFMEDLMDTD